MSLRRDSRTGRHRLCTVIRWVEGNSFHGFAFNKVAMKMTVPFDFQVFAPQSMAIPRLPCVNRRPVTPLVLTRSLPRRKWESTGPRLPPKGI